MCSTNFLFVSVALTWLTLVSISATGKISTRADEAKRSLPGEPVKRALLIPGLDHTAHPGPTPASTSTDTGNAIKISIPDSSLTLNIYLLPQQADLTKYKSLFDAAVQRIHEQIREHGREGIVPRRFRQREPEYGFELNTEPTFSLQWFDMADIMRGFQILAERRVSRVFRFDVFHHIKLVAAGDVVKLHPVQSTTEESTPLFNSEDLS